MYLPVAYFLSSVQEFVLSSSIHAIITGVVRYDVLVTSCDLYHDKFVTSCDKPSIRKVGNGANCLVFKNCPYYRGLLYISIRGSH